MKKSGTIGQDLLFALVFFAIFLPFFLCAPLYDFYKQFNAAYGIFTGGIKFAVLSTLGEVLALRIRTGGYGLKGFGVGARMAVWFLLGTWIVVSMKVFGKGAPAVVDYIFCTGGKVSASMAGPLTWHKAAGAFSISLLMNTSFAPVFMTLHKITDTHIMAHGGRFSSLFRRIDMAETLAHINWKVQWGFVFKKTIPFFWIPAHTLTFMLPAEYQVLFAAFLGVVLGLIMAVAANKK